MSKKAKCEAKSWSDFKNNEMAGSKCRDMSAMYGSSVLQPKHSVSSSMRCQKISSTDHAGGDASTPYRITKVLWSTAIYTNGCCRLNLPSEFCEKHKVERNVTMTDSSQRKLWHMRFQSCSNPKQRTYVISNGWKEFSYDHNLKINDRLVFTLTSTSHFVVEFATWKGSTRAMLPRRNGEDYPWRINHSRLDCLNSADLQGVTRRRKRSPREEEEGASKDDGEYANNGVRGVKKKKIRKNVADVNNRDTAAVNGSSIDLQTNPPEHLKFQSSTRRRRRIPSKDGIRYANIQPASSTSRSFTKTLSLSSGINTGSCSRLVLPRRFCEKHNVKKSVITMTDSTGHRLWHMRFQWCGFVNLTRSSSYAISNGWREFFYDHNLKIYDRLVFTLVSTSHFIVEFATSNGSTRPMLPTRDGKHYPWKINYSRLNCLSFAGIQGGKKEGIRKNVAVYGKRSDTSAVNESSIHLQPNPPKHLIPSSRRRKRSPSKDGEERGSRDDEQDDEENANNGPPITSRSFTKMLTLKCGVHTARCFRLIFPRGFCEKHNVERNVTMTDTTGQKLWHMEIRQDRASQASCRWKGPNIYGISNGWREFAYDHNLKSNDKLVFTLVSTSHFIVEFATRNGSTRAMLPRRNGKDYPWKINYARLDSLSVAGDQGGKGKVQKKVASIALRHKQKAQKMFCQCKTSEVGNGMNTSNDTRKKYVIRELTHLECKNSDGSSYLQIMDSDSDSEMTSVDHED